MQPLDNEKFCIPYEVGIYLYTGINTSKSGIKIRPDIFRKFCERCGKEILKENQLCIKAKNGKR